MNFRVFIFIISAVILSIEAYSPPVVFNTKAQDDDGQDVCSYDHVQIAPLQTLNQPGKCRELYCGADFALTISNCLVDPSGKCHWDGADNTLSYPDCCGFKLCT